MRSNILELSFSDKHLRDLCYSAYLAQEFYGPELAESLRNRMADLAAVLTVSELFYLPGNTQELSGDRQSQMSIELIHGWKLIFQSGHLNTPSNDDGKTDWCRVRRVKLIGLEHFHE